MSDFNPGFRSWVQTRHCAPIIPRGSASGRLFGAQNALFAATGCDTLSAGIAGAGFPGPTAVSAAAISAA